MDKVNEILNDLRYRSYLKRLELLEEDRKFCRHTMEHFLDVARIAYIKVLESKLNYSKEVIYGVALLHDIGRVLEYEECVPHHEGSVIIAEEILDDTSFSQEDKDSILRAIEAHRKDDSKDELSKIIYASDKVSRNCFNCKAIDECYWSDNKKNFYISY
ncbi:MULTISPECIES: HD domain-containing protein [Clostridium]|uniref:HD domain-containing protein n=1 Tax=Clostridium cibarium TaxID=2762247 RepID=A0ABR8PP30_9CLOT|nr:MULTISPECIES: HD domain-containing protein [Clostridium]MBD7909921.1 HD domain-containing protein [Clostridium cibarium]